MLPTMRIQTFLMILGLCLASAVTAAASYSTDITLIRQSESNRCEVEVTVSKLSSSRATSENIIARARVAVSLGKTAKSFVGVPGAKKESLSVELSWPEGGTSDHALCWVTLNRGPTVLVANRFRLKTLN